MSTSKSSIIEREATRAADVLRAGGVILYPTDTIWGLGCDATQMAAVQRIFEIKRRSDSKSMLVLMPGLSMLEAYLESIPPKALEVLESVTRPTTIIYPGARRLASNLLAEDGSVGIRLTREPFCVNLMERMDVPLVSTSANVSGQASPATFSEISPEIAELVDYVVDWRREEEEPATPSTILKIEKDGTLITLRP
jgi:L-threonylcarbamoyladenylate synthase